MTREMTNAGICGTFVLLGANIGGLKGGDAKSVAKRLAESMPNQLKRFI